MAWFCRAANSEGKVVRAPRKVDLADKLIFCCLLDVLCWFLQGQLHWLLYLTRDGHFCAGRSDFGRVVAKRLRVYISHSGTLARRFIANVFFFFFFFFFFSRGGGGGGGGGPYKVELICFNLNFGDLVFDAFFFFFFFFFFGCNQGFVKKKIICFLFLFQSVFMLNITDIFIYVICCWFFWIDNYFQYNQIFVVVVVVVVVDF